MAVPDYLHGLVDEAEEYMIRDGVSPQEAAQEVAHLHNEVWNNRRGKGHRDNLEVLKDLRDQSALCADELDIYRDSSNEPFAQATIAALTERSLEEFLANSLGERA